MSGAKNCPETPRQKMIGMMYLVLTAMLALNVSADILNGFAMVSKSLRSSIQSSDARAASLFDDFEYAYQQNPEKMKEWLDKAKNVRTMSDDLFNYIQDFKKAIVRQSDGAKYDTTLVVVNGASDTNAPGNYGLRMKDKEGVVNATALKQRIEKYRDAMMELTADSLKREMYSSLFYTGEGRTTSGEAISWENSIFESMPVSAVLALLTKTQSDIRIAELDMVQYLKGQTDASDFRVNSIEALVIPSTKYVIRGGKYSAQIVLAAVDTTAKPIITVNGATLGANGLYEAAATSLGEHTFTGLMRIPKGDGTAMEREFKGDYIVGEPSATISNIDMNVVYRGIDNKFSISVPGVANEKVAVTVDGGTCKKAGPQYIVNANRDGEITINVSADMDGKRVQMGSMKYRVKYLPDPKAFIQYNDAGGIPKTTQDERLSVKTIKNPATTLIASYGADELIKANFKVTSFSMVTKYGSLDSRGPKFTSEQLAQIDRLKSGDYITLRSIKAVGPDGKSRNLGLIQIQL